MLTKKKKLFNINYLNLVCHAFDRLVKKQDLSFTFFPHTNKIELKNKNVINIKRDRKTNKFSFFLSLESSMVFTLCVRSGEKETYSPH